MTITTTKNPYSLEAIMGGNWRCVGTSRSFTAAKNLKGRMERKNKDKQFRIVRSDTREVMS